LTAVGSHDVGSVADEGRDRFVEVGRGRGKSGHEFVHPAAVVEVDTDDLGRVDGCQVDGVGLGHRSSVGGHQARAVGANLHRVAIEEDSSELVHVALPNVVVA
jgi:hypothetical protein